MAAAAPVLPYIATFAAVKTAYDANKAQKEAKAMAATAQAQQQEQSRIAQENASAMQAQMEAQTRAQQAAADAARQRLEAEQNRYAEEKATMEAEAKKRAQEIEAQRRDMAEREAGRIRARVRGGRRMLLSDARLNPEVGMLGGQTNLGAQVQQ